MMILIIDICKDDLHRMEFVKPIEDIISAAGNPFMTVRYKDLKKSHLDESHRIIISGTSLADNDYAKASNLKRFMFLKDYPRPVLGICGGMQILCMVNRCSLARYLEIGLTQISLTAPFLGVDGKREVYTLHNFCIKDDDALRKQFRIYAFSKGTNGMTCVQAVRHKDKAHFGVLFHPEVRNKDIVANFLSE